MPTVSVHACGNDLGTMGDMTTLAHLRKSALSLAETDERRDAEAIVFAVCGKKFAALEADQRVWLRLAGDDASGVLAEHPAAERRGAGVSVPLDGINGQQLNHWLRRAWLARAPRRLTVIVADEESVTPGVVGDLPKAIGRPATRALASAGITTLAQVAALSEAELLAMHGVGPKAVRLLREALNPDAA
jgi:hypothetical protein